MSKASRERKEGSKNYNRSKLRIGNECSRKSMTLKSYRKWCRAINKHNRRVIRNRRNFLSLPKMHLELKRKYKMSKASRREKEDYKNCNRQACKGDPYQYRRGIMTLKSYKQHCRWLERTLRKEKRHRNNFFSLSEL